MPGGLQGVEQVFTADASGYLAAVRQIIDANQGLASSVRDTMSQVRDAQGSLKGAGGGADDIAKTNASIRDTLASLREYQTVVRDTASVVNSASAGYETMRASISEVGDAHAEAAEQIRATSDASGDFAASLAEQVAAQKAANDAAMVLIKSHLAGNQILRDSGTSARSYVTDLGAVKDAARDTSSALADVATAAAAVQSGSGGGGSSGSLVDFARSLGQTTPEFAAYADAQRAAQAADIAKILGTGGGGGGGFAGGGGGGGGGGGFAAWMNKQPDGSKGFVPWGGGGATAVRFWGMAIAEAASTIVPAVVAAGAGALVGMQGVEQIAPFLSGGLRPANEALGGAYGTTMGQFFGGGTSLQSAQNQATGGAYELLGAVINMAKAGGGKGLVQEGLDTVSMIDRGVANISPDLPKRLAAALGGGTGYLRQFGDVFGNLGNTLLNVAPDLPGVGSDLLSTLQGGTGLLSAATRDIPTPLLKGFFGYEAASRWLPALLGGSGLIGRALGLSKIGGIGGLISKGGESLFARGAGGVLGDIGLGMVGAGDALGGLGAGAVGLPVAAMIAEWAALNKLPTGASGVAARNIAGLQSGVTAGGFSDAWQPLAKAITETTGLAAANAGTYAAPTRQQLASRVGIGLQAAYAESPESQYTKAAQGFSQTMGSLVAAGPQLVTALHHAGLKSVSMGDAFQIAQNSLLDLTHAFDSHGQLTKTAQQMMKNYVAAIGPMTQSGGGFMAAVAAGNIMSQGAVQNLQKVNQSMDAMTQIMEAGPMGMASLAGAKGAVTPGMAKALTSFTSPGGQVAWNAFASTSTTNPGIVTQLQQFNDQMRTGLTMSALTQPQAAGLTGYELKQFLPQAKQSPAALAMLMQQGAQEGVTGYYDPSKSQAQNYAAAVAATNKIADNSRQANAAMTSMTVKLSNLPAISKQFLQGTGADIQSQQIAKAAQDAMKIKGGVNVKVNAADLVSQLRAAGVQGAAALKASLDAVLTQAGVGKAERIKIEAQVTGTAQVKTLQQMLNALHDKNVNVHAAANTAAVLALQGAIAAVHDKSVTVTVTTINRMITQYIGAATPPGGVAPATLVGAGNIRLHGQTGMKIPGYGGGDIWPAMLEPGELVVPKHMVAAGMVNHLRGTIPGFAAGGIVPGGTAANLGLLSVMMGQVPGAQLPIPAIAQQVLDQLLRELSKQGAWKQAAVQIVNGITYSLNGTGADASKVGRHLVSETAKDAKALASKVATELNFARGVSGAAMTGQGFGTPGLISGMDPTQDTVGNQMQTYLTSVKSFASDLKTLTKGGLSKDILKQLIAAGPTQGDALAQSILTGGGTSGAGAGISQVNKLWRQIGISSHALGAQAAMSVYGGTIAPNLRSGTVSVGGIVINVSAPGGAAGNLNLTPAQIKIITEQVQAALLKQARRNNRTGVQAAGKGA